MESAHTKIFKWSWPKTLPYFVWLICSSLSSISYIKHSTSIIRDLAGFQPVFQLRQLDSFSLVSVWLASLSTWKIWSRVRTFLCYGWLSHIPVRDELGGQNMSGLTYLCKEKSRIRETPKLSTDADSSPNVFVSAAVKKRPIAFFFAIYFPVNDGLWKFITHTSFFCTSEKPLFSSLTHLLFIQTQDQLCICFHDLQLR